MAITWRNIEAPDLRGVGALMGQANAGITNMGNAFQTALTDWNTNQQKKVDEQKTQNTDAFLNNLYANYNSPEALKAAISSGEFGRQIAGYGTNIDSAKVRGAPEALLGSRQQQALTGMEFENKSIANADAPTQALYQANALKGTPEALAENEALMQQLNPRNRGAAAAIGFDAAGKLIDRGITQATEGRNVLAAQSKLETEANQRQTSMMGAQAQQMQARAAAASAASAASVNALRARELNDNWNDKQTIKQAEMSLTRAAANQAELTKEHSSNLDSVAARVPGVPYNKDGSINMAAMTPEVMKDVRDAAGRMKLPIDAAFGTDTAAKNAFIKEQRANGVSDRVTNGILASNLQAFNNAAPDKTGLEAQLQSNRQALNDLVEKRQFEIANKGLTTVTSPEDKDTLYKVLSDNVKELPASGRAKYLSTMTDYVRNGGITVGNENGVPIKVLPSANELKVIMQSADPTWWYPNSTEMSARLKTWERANANTATAAYKNKELMGASKFEKQKKALEAK